MDFKLIVCHLTTMANAHDAICCFFDVGTPQLSLSDDSDHIAATKNALYLVKISTL